MNLTILEDGKIIFIKILNKFIFYQDQVLSVNNYNY